MPARLGADWKPSPAPMRDGLLKCRRSQVQFLALLHPSRKTILPPPHVTTAAGCLRAIVTVVTVVTKEREEFNFFFSLSEVSFSILAGDNRDKRDNRWRLPRECHGCHLPPFEKNSSADLTHVHRALLYMPATSSRLSFWMRPLALSGWPCGPRFTSGSQPKPRNDLKRPRGGEGCEMS